ncbi:hypothetical protein [Nocardia sp. CDC160]|uniref:hypothetical protein n=1 Tax=Nocardia sp. CDC160 TaxID=3112166 RepID=UPI002DB88C29|nr:hypothetical protein [Nocardia sp. CDC160]MEC3917316.1 hypothetical protein [Nocardia sp. CDC160]
MRVGRRVRSYGEASTVYMAAVVAGLAIMAPVDLEEAMRAPTPHLDVLANDAVHAAAGGVLIAAVVAVVLTVHGSVRVAWAVAGCGAVVLLVDHLIAGSGLTTLELVSLMYADAGGGGLLLGGLARVALGRRRSATALTIGALTAAVVGNHTRLAERAAERAQPAERWQWHLIDSPPRPLVVLAVILVLGAAIANRRTRSRLWFRAFPFAPVCGGLLALASALLAWEWLAAGEPRLPRLVEAGAVLLAGALTAAFSVPGLDGAIVLLSSVFTLVWGELAPVRLPIADLAVLPVVIAVAYFAGSRWRSPLLGWTALAVIALGAACAGHSHHAAIVVGVPALGSAMGYAWAATTPARAVSRSIALPLLFTPSLVLAIRRPRGTADLVDKPAWTAATLVLACGLGFGVLAVLRRRSG